MDLTREALEFIQKSAAPTIIEHAGDQYSDKKLQLLPNYRYPDPLGVSTLSSMIDYIKADIDSIHVDGEQYIILIESPTTVHLISELDDDMVRRFHMKACARLPHFALREYLEREAFQIQLASCFADLKDESVVSDKALLLSFISTVQAGTIAAYSDSGISQKATVINGILNEKQDVLVPNPVTLAPYRTFIDVEQPSSSFLFRMKDTECRDGNKAISCGLWEADGGAWKMEAVSNIKRYFREQLGEELLKKFIIIG